MGTAATCAFALATPVFAWSSETFGVADWTPSNRAAVYVGAALLPAAAAGWLTAGAFSLRRIARFVGVAMIAALVCQAEELAQIFGGDRIVPAYIAAPVVVSVACAAAGLAAVAIVIACAASARVGAFGGDRVDAADRAASPLAFVVVLVSVLAFVVATAHFDVRAIPALVPTACFALAVLIILLANARIAWRELVVHRIARGRHRRFRLVPIDPSACAPPLNAARDACNAMLVRGEASAYRDGSVPLALVRR
jgi:hypothetical protein